MLDQSLQFLQVPQLPAELWDKILRYLCSSDTFSTVKLRPVSRLFNNLIMEIKDVKYILYLVQIAVNKLNLTKETFELSLDDDLMSRVYEGGMFAVE